jgi:hypothetical protein
VSELARDHSQCVETIEGDTLTHECGACPHGALRGGTTRLHGDPELDELQRALKLHTLDRLTCDSRGHAEALGSAPMSLFEQAHRLLDRQPVDKDGRCIHCERVPMAGGHALDCAWLVPHRRILAVLELINKVAPIAVWSDDVEAWTIDGLDRVPPRSTGEVAP